MRLEIKGLAELRARLQALRPADIMAAALAAEAERLAQSVRDGLATPPGAGGHDRPWAQTGALRDSIEVTAEGFAATIGSNDPAAAPQELGTAKLPPRPFLAPVAASAGQDVAASVGSRVAAALRGESSDPNVIQANAVDTAAAGLALLGVVIGGVAYLSSRNSSSPRPSGPTLPAPLMTESPPKSESEGENDTPAKPEYRSNAAHDRRGPRYNRRAGPKV